MGFAMKITRLARLARLALGNRSSHKGRNARRAAHTLACAFEGLEARALFSGGPVGDEFMVNTYTPGYQVNAAVASDADGDSVVVWETETGTFDGYDIHGQRYNALGERVGEEFLVSTWH